MQKFLKWHLLREGAEFVHNLNMFPNYAQTFVTFCRNGYPCNQILLFYVVIKRWKNYKTSLQNNVMHIAL